MTFSEYTVHVYRNSQLSLVLYVLLFWRCDGAPNPTVIQPAVTEGRHDACIPSVMRTVADFPTLVAHSFIQSAETVVAAIERLLDVLPPSDVPGTYGRLVLVLPTVALTVGQTTPNQAVSAMTGICAVRTASEVRFGRVVAPTRTALVPGLQHKTGTVVIVRTLPVAVRVIVRGVSERQCRTGAPPIHPARSRRRLQTDLDVLPLSYMQAAPATRYVDYAHSFGLQALTSYLNLLSLRL